MIPKKLLKKTIVDLSKEGLWNIETEKVYNKDYGNEM